MDEPGGHHPEWGNPITKEHTWYAPTDKWILVQNLGIPKIKFTDHMNLKKKDNQSVDTLILLNRENKIHMGRDRETKCGADTEGKERLPPLGIHPICSHQIQTLLWMPTSACWQEPNIDSARAWQIPRGMLPANHWTEHRVPNGGVRERTEGAEGVCNHRKNNSINQPDPPELPGTKPPIKE